MFRDIQVRSRRDMIALSYELDEPSIIISISDASQEHPVFADNANVKDVLFLNFDDEESEEAGGMNASNAESVAEFVRAWEQEDVSLYVHCGAGVSRSAGTAAAVMLWNWGDDSQVFQDAHYCPNMRCYRMVLDALDVSYDDIQIAKKEREQYLLWAAENL